VNRQERRAMEARRRNRPKRSCGPCQACCSVLGVPELGKLSGDPCPHACSKGCGTYQNRPESCRAYECLWLQGLFREEDRPDQIGLVVDTNKTGTMVVVREIHEGDFDKPEAQNFVRSIPKELTVYVMLKNGKRVILHD